MDKKISRKTVSKCWCFIGDKSYCCDCDDVYLLVNRSFLGWLKKEIRLAERKSKTVNKPTHSEWVSWDSRKETLIQVWKAAHENQPKKT